MTRGRQPLFMKCEKCGDFQHHYLIYLESFKQWQDKSNPDRTKWKIHYSDTGFKGKGCYSCDTLRDIEPIEDVKFKGHTLETPPIETALQKTQTDCEGRE